MLYRSYGFQILEWVCIGEQSCTVQLLWAKLIWELLTAFVPALLRVIQLFKTFPVSLGSDNAITLFCLYFPPPPPLGRTVSCESKKKQLV